MKKSLNISEEIRNRLFSLGDKEYHDFQAKLMPTVSPSEIIGVRTPIVRKLAKEYSSHKDIGEFLNSLPHKYYEENNLHSFLVAEIKDFDLCLAKVEKFLPYIDNWATCDSFAPKCFKKHTGELLTKIKEWLSSDSTYTVRFAVKMLMDLYLDSEFSTEYLYLVANIKSNEYYINMACAWYYATALAKQYESAISLIEEKALSPWVHNKAIQKAVESYRITQKQKEYLKGLKFNH